MLSIKNDREMDINKIKQRFPRESSPNIKAYRKALRLIKNELIDKPQVDNCLEEKYRIKAKEIIKDYLSRLIKELS